MSEQYPAEPNNLERDTDRPHTARYLLARGFVRPGETVIDAACGTGYGSYLISQIAGQVYSFDYKDVFRKEWRASNIEYCQKDLEKDDVPYCDMWISIETIEHLHNPQKFLDKIVAATSRCIIITSPNKSTKDESPWHNSDVELVVLQRMMDKYPEWMPYHSFLQGYYYIAIYMKKEAVIL